MKQIIGALKNKHFRASAQSGLNTAARLPNSDFTTVDNSQGASRVASELLASLDAILHQIDFEDNPYDQLIVELEDLDTKVAKYVNSSVTFCTSAEQWECDRTEAEVIGLAWDCALKAYKPVATSQPERPERTGSRVDFLLPSSATGRIKATTCTIFTPPHQPEMETMSASCLVIAVRGSASKVDHIVNFNSEPRDAKALFKIVKAGESSETANIALHAHAGFLNSALELMKQLSNRVENHLKENPRTNILFTGHSAGGAVASLLHLSFRAKFATIFSGATFSCITFGSPPVAKYLSQSDKTALNESISNAHILNIVNEYDLVARADKDYIQSLTELYGSIGPHDSKQDGNHRGGNKRLDWPPPAPVFQHIGPIIVLKNSPPTSDMKCGTSSLPGLVLSAWKITAEDLSRLIFCRLSVHSRTVYEERIQKIESGCLNGRMCWSFVTKAASGEENKDEKDLDES